MAGEGGKTWLDGMPAGVVDVTVRSFIAVVVVPEDLDAATVVLSLPPKPLVKFSERSYHLAIALRTSFPIEPGLASAATPSCSP